MICQGDCVELMGALEPESIDAIVTDPPYELGFMGRAWDSSGVAYRPETWEAAWHALRPGGHLLAFGGTRTYHRLAVAVEDAGFEIRDCLAWLYGSGFPKSRNLGDGWGTALKPAHEPIVMARKPLVGTVAANVAAHGTGAINVDGCRVEFAGEADEAETPGRWPANVLLDPEAAALLDEQTGVLAAGNHPASRQGIGFTANGGGRNSGTAGERRPTERGGASRFFYCAKASRAERNAGCGDFEKRPLNWSSGEQNPGSFQAEGTDRSARNHHPTVKPIALMRWLCRLVTPPGGTVLDPFTGSGTTGIAAALEGFEFTGFELDPEYVSIAEARIAHWSAQPEQLGFE